MQQRLPAQQVDLADRREETRHALHVGLELVEVGEGGLAEVGEVRAALAVQVAVVGDVNLEVVEHRLAAQDVAPKPHRSAESR